MLLVRILTASFLCFLAWPSPAVEITLEHAVSPDEMAWGLMQRRTLPENHGMLFKFHPPRRVAFWMLNTFIDLSLAYLDANGVIREIHQLKAYPDKMMALAPIKDVSALNRLPPYDPVVRFFQQHEVRSSFAVSYALEMNAGWFERHGVKVGDRLNISHGSANIGARRQE